MHYFKKILGIGVVLIATTTIIFALEAEYRFEKCDGTASLENHAGSGLNANLSGDANISLGGGKIINGLMLSGSGMMSVEHSPELDLVKNLTISFWINPAEIKKQALVTRGLGIGTDRKYASNAEYFIKMKDNGQLSYRHSFVESNGSVVAYSDTNLSTDVWTHVLFTRDSSAKTMRFYINGIASSEYSYTVEPKSSNSEKLLFGHCDGCVNPSNFVGKLDEIKIYNTLLSQDEIIALYNSEKEGEHTTGGCHPAPLIVDDSFDLPFEGVVTIDILANDRTNDSESCSINSSTVMIRSNPVDSNLSDDNKTLIVAGEGNWSVQSNGSMLFTSENSFNGNPTDIKYTVSDSCGTLSNEASISLTRVAPISVPSLTSTPTPTPTPIATPIPTYTPVISPTPISTPISTQIPTATPTPTPIPTATTVKVGGLVWYDINRDGIQDSSEQGVADVTVVLFDINNSVIDRTSTNESGVYQLSVSINNSYTIGFSNLPKNYSFTSQNMGSSNSKDSDVDSSGRTEEFMVDSIEDNLAYDAGVVSSIDNIIIHPSIDNNSSLIEDCDCDNYKSTIPSMNVIGLIVIWLLVSLFGVIFLRGDEFDFSKK
jgi:hypothetical protein